MNARERRNARRAHLTAAWQAEQARPVPPRSSRLSSREIAAAMGAPVARPRKAASPVMPSGDGSGRPSEWTRPASLSFRERAVADDRRWSLTRADFLPA